MVDLHHSSKIKRHKEVTKLQIKFFFIFLLVDGKIRIRTNKLRIQIHEAQKIRIQIRKTAGNRHGFVQIHALAHWWSKFGNVI